MKAKHSKITSKSAPQKGRVSSREIIIPIIAAIMASLVTILLNQLFFKKNAKNQIEFELRKEIYKEQLPVINRILNMTSNFTTITQPYAFKNGKVLVEIKTHVDQNGNVLYSDSTIYNDTIYNLTLPDFIHEENKRHLFITNINKLKAQIKSTEYDQDLALAIEDVLNFIDENPIPKDTYDQSKFDTKWNNEDRIKKWYSLISKLRIICCDKKQEFNLK